jgi:ADP-heptose:LPS heptosyltransferase/predicted SAM-dependent methyltransferase
MVWRITDPQCNEGAKVKWEIVEWTRGKGLEMGSGIQKLYPHFIGVDNKKDEQLFGHPIAPDLKVDTAERIDFIASGSMDFVFSSHMLEHIEPERVTGCLKEWMRLIRPKGYLVLYLPDEDEYPKVGKEGANPDHKWDVNYERVVQYMRASTWDLVEFQKRNEGREYSLLFVFQKTNSGQHESWKSKEKPKQKTCGVVRYGAFGDLIQASSVFAALKDEGYHITLYTSPPGDEVIKHDPNIDAFYLQDKDQVPNHLLGEFWDYHKQRYDKWVNLSESVEGTFLALPGRTLHNWPPLLRHQLMDRNYLDVQHGIAGVEGERRMRFYPTQDEVNWARKQRQKMGEFLVAWPLAGSSPHKLWPGLDGVVASLMIDFPQLEVVFMGGDAAKLLEQGWEKERRVHKRCGQWSIRQSMAFMAHVDMAIGPETGLMNCAAYEEYPKVVFLSHSSENNLTRDWPNTHSLWGKNTHCPGRGENEAPACHQLHYNWDHCKKTEQSVAQCQADISGEEAYKVIWHAVTHALKERAAA